MKANSLILIAGFLALFPQRSFAYAQRGDVVFHPSGCDYYIVDTNGDYALLEWYGSYDPDVDDVLYGTFTTYGFRWFWDNSTQSFTRAWIEDYGLSVDDAYQQYADHCN